MANFALRGGAGDPPAGPSLDAREVIRRNRERRERERRRAWPFPPNQFVRASELLEASPVTDGEVAG